MSEVKLEAAATGEPGRRLVPEEFFFLLQRIDRLDEKLALQIAELRAEMRSEVSALRGEMDALRSEMNSLRGEINSLRGDVGAALSGMRADLAGWDHAVGQRADLGVPRRDGRGVGCGDRAGCKVVVTQLGKGASGFGRGAGPCGASSCCVHARCVVALRCTSCSPGQGTSAGVEQV